MTHTGITSTQSNVAASAVDEYRRARESFFARRGAAWPGTLYDAFDILAPYELQRAEVNGILQAAAALGRIYESAAGLLRRLPDEALVEMGIPVHVLPSVRCSISGVFDPVIGRFDLARTEGGYKLLEYNADVPALIVEAFSINAEVCSDLGCINPNASHERLLSRALKKAVTAGFENVRKRVQQRGKVVVASARGCRRDQDIAQYMCRLLSPLEADHALIESLSVGADGLYDQSGRAIDVLYRIFPLQCIRDGLFRGKRTDLHSEMGGEVLQLVRDRRLALINSPFAFLLECKALQALIWNLCASGHYFGEAERHLIERYMLPTSLDAPVDGTAYVMKPAYGAEGDTVKIMTSEGTVMHNADCTTYADQPMVFQKYVKLPREEIMTEYGVRSLSLLTSCFLISGTPAGICMRAGEAITDESAWVLPVCVA